MTDLNAELLGITGDIKWLLPQLVLVATLITILLADLVFLLRDKVLAFLSGLGILISGIISLEQFSQVSLEDAFNGMVTITNLTAFWQLFLSAVTLIVLSMCVFREKKQSSLEFYSLIIGILLGVHVLVMSSNFLMLYFSLELVSLCSYAITFFAFNKQTSESSLKYLLFGAAASAIMLYGLSLLFAITGTLDFTGQAFIDNMLAANPIPVIVASILVLSGFLFKISAFPFHLWVPDVYETAPTPVVAYFSVVPKIGGIAILIKVVLTLNLFGQAPINWGILLAVLSMLTIAVGNLSALFQFNIKRLLAYSAIAQTGFMLAGLAAFSETSLVNVIFYTCIYTVAGIGAFMIVHFFERRHGKKEISSLSGVVNSYPYLSILLLVMMVSLTGLPPTAGFTAKFLIFSSIWESYTYNNNGWLLALLAFGLVNTVVALFYYLKIPYYMIFKPMSEELQTDNNYLYFENYLSAFLVVAVLLLFFRPDWLMGIINNINFAF